MSKLLVKGWLRTCRITSLIELFHDIGVDGDELLDLTIVASPDLEIQIYIEVTGAHCSPWARWQGRD
jgi:hypothetical protein